MTTTTPPLREALADYLHLRRALGFKLKAAGRLLGQFVDYLEAGGFDTITIENALEWATLPVGGATTWPAIRLSAVRGFAVFLSGTGHQAQIPPTGILRRGSDRATPYLYRAEEITALLQAAGALRPALRAATYQALIGLLAVSGIRIGEAIAADTADLDIDQGLLTVRETKFGKTRLIPLHPSTITALTTYVSRRDRLPVRSAPALFLSTAGTRLLHANINVTFTKLTEAAGLAHRSASCRPRIHDLRHTFAVDTLLDWYATGADVPALLPALSAYLGHTDPKNTYWYLSAAPELMALAGNRLDAYLEGHR